MAEGGARAPLAPIRQHQPQAALGTAACAPPLRPVIVPPCPAPTPAPLLRVAPTPRILYLQRSRTEGHGFGFTLRHFIIYPPENLTDLFYDGRHAAVGAVRECMDTIFVKSVREDGPAHRAGLRPGDRLLVVEGRPITGWPYANVVQLIQQASHTLTVQVVPKEADVLQRYFSEAAHNPETNQRPQNRPRERRTSAGEMPLGLGLGAGGPAPPTHPHYVPPIPITYRPNTNNAKLTNDYPLHNELQCLIKVDQGKARNSIPINLAQSGIQSAESANRGAISRLAEAQPQVPQQSKNQPSRRSSEGARLSTVDPTSFYASPPSSPNYSSRDSASCYSADSSTKSSNSHRRQMAPVKAIPSHMMSLNQAQSRVPVQYNNKFNFDDRRESNNSLASSATESKDSLSSRESMSTLTGTDPDNFNILSSRMRKSFEQKEAFLNRPCQPTGWATDQNVIQQREFYARPQKLHKPMWPPLISADYSPSKNKENIEDNSVRNVLSPSIYETINHVSAIQPSDASGASKVDLNKPSSSKQKHDKALFHSTLSKIQENTPVFNDSGGNMTNGSSPMSNSFESMLQEKRYPIPSELQIVSNRTRQFESLPSEDRTAMYKSELARLSTKKPEPTVALRRQEFESRGGKRDARSLEAQHSLDDAEIAESNFSGNRMIVTGGKYLTCPPPEGYQPENETVPVRLRSNSTGSEGLPARRTHAPDGSHMKRRLALSKEEVEALNSSSKENWSNGDACNGTITPASAYKCDIIDKQVPNGFNNVDNVFVNKSNLIPTTNLISKSEATDTVNHFNDKSKQEPEPKVLPIENYKNNKTSAGEKRPERPTQLSLAPGEKFSFGGLSGTQNLGSSPTTPSSLPSQPQSPSGVSIDDGAVVRRPKNASDFGAEEERAMRRVSYLKATWADHLNYGDDDQQAILRSDKKEREDFPHDTARMSAEELEGGEVTFEGYVHIKMVLTNHKRASDRSWKHVYAVLQGSKLIIYRNQHQSPTVGGSSESLNLQFSMAEYAGDYTKRKHVLRVTSAHGVGLLLQAGSAEDAKNWLDALQAQASKGQVTEPQKGIDQPQSGGLSPPPHSKKHSNQRNVSPTENTTSSLTASPKSKTWKGRVARQLRRMQTGGTGTSPLGTPGAINMPRPTGVVGIPLEQCESMPTHPCVPNIVGFFTRTVEERGLHVVGLYRIPGNKSSVTALMESLERSTSPDLNDTRWNDVNVVSSLLKTFFRRLPNPLLTEELYPKFISADKISDNSERVHTIRKLIKDLPDYHYETLKFLMEHLKRVSAENAVNKMEARNLAIVFGPTLVRSADDNMLTMVNDMSSQCRIIESLINNMDWYFDDEDRSSPVIEYDEELPSTTSNQALLLQNVKKIEGKMDVSTKDIVSSIISAANKKIQFRPKAKYANVENSSPNHSKTREADKTVTSPTDLNVDQSSAAAKSSPIPGNDNHPNKTHGETDKNKWLERDKQRDIKSNEWQKNLRIGTASPITTIDNVDGQSGGLDATGNSNLSPNNKTNVSGKRLKTDSMVSNDSFSDGTADMVSSLTSTFDQKLRALHSPSPLDDSSIPYVDECHEETHNLRDPSLHRSTDVLNRALGDSKRNSDDRSKSETDSIKSANSCSQEVITLKPEHKRYSLNVFPQKSSVKLTTSDKPYKESLEKRLQNDNKDKYKGKNVEGSSDSEKDVDINSEQSSPDHVTPDNNRSAEKFCFPEKPIHTDKIPCDNKNVRETTDGSLKVVIQDNYLKKSNFATDRTDIINTILAKSKLKRSESLNRDAEKQMIKNNKLILSEICNKNDAKDAIANNEDKSNSPKLRRSVSLNRSDVKVKRSDSLTKNEKTETNILRRKDLNYSGLNRASAKLKRKNGMPERSIKRRHTVGGTKDFDKDEWVARSCSRTSSPDLPATITDVAAHRHISPIPLESHV